MASDPRTLEEIQAEYTRLMAEGGDLFFKIRELEAALKAHKERMAQIEARRLELQREGLEARKASVTPAQPEATP
jgi:cell division septum initiation protein DivIVA